MKQNKNSSVAFRAAAVALATVFLFCSLAIPSFAVNSSGVLEVPYVSGANSASNISSFNSLFLFSNGSYKWYLATGSTDPVYAVAYYSDVNHSVVSIQIVSETQQTTSTPSAERTYGYWQYIQTGVFYDNMAGNGLTSQLDNTTGLYYASNPPESLSASSIVDMNSDFIIYNDLASALSAVSGFISSSSGLFDSPHSIDYSLPAGNVAFIDVTNLNPSFSLSIYNPILQWSNTSLQYYGTMNSIPSSFSVPISGTSIIPWSGTGKTDMLGRYSNWSYSGSVSGSASGHNHVYLAIVNPTSQLATNNADGSISPSGGNPNISIHVSTANGIRVFSLKETFSYGAPTSDQGEKDYTGAIDPDTGELIWKDTTTGEVTTAPNYGGDNLVDSSTGTINDFLQRIANTISSFFSGAIGAVTTLVNAGSAFINQLISLYSWLPAPVYSVLSSALVLVITIGVIKVFI